MSTQTCATCVHFTQHGGQESGPAEFAHLWTGDCAADELIRLNSRGVITYRSYFCKLWKERPRVPPPPPEPTIKIRAKPDGDGVSIWLGWDGDDEVFIIGQGTNLGKAIVDASKALGLANQTVLHLTPADVKDVG